METKRKNTCIIIGFIFITIIIIITIKYIYDKTKENFISKRNEKTCTRSTFAEPSSQMHNWMTKYWDALKNKKLTNLYLPGSHHAGSYHINSKLGFSKDDNIIKQIPSQLQKKWVKTQKNNVLKQLKYGVRYLHIGIENIGNKIYCINGFYGVLIDDILKNIATFIKDKNHEKEYIVIEIHQSFQSKNNNDPNVITILNKKLKRFLGNTILPQFSILKSLEELHNKYPSGRILLIGNGLHKKYDPHKIFNHYPSYIRSHAINKDNGKDVIVESRKKIEKMFHKNVESNTFDIIQPTISINSNIHWLSYGTLRCMTVKQFSHKNIIHLVQFGNSILKKPFVVLMDYVDHYSAYTIPRIVKMNVMKNDNMHSKWRLIKL